MKKGDSILHAHLTPLIAAAFLLFPASCGVEEDAAPLSVTNGTAYSEQTVSAMSVDEITRHYAAGIAYYEERKYRQAIKEFCAVMEHEDAPDYINACGIAIDLEEYCRGHERKKNALYALGSYSNRIDVEQIVMEPYLMEYYLDSTWQTETGEMFQCNIDDRIYDFTQLGIAGESLPNLAPFFRQGVMRLEEESEVLAEFRYVDFDTVEIVVPASGKSYVCKRTRPVCISDSPDGALCCQ